jgi:hypothetical protein
VGNSAPGDAQVTGDALAGSPGIGQLIGCNTDVVELLADGKGNAVAVVQAPTPCRQDGSLGPLPLRLVGPAFALEELELCRARENHCDR